MIECVRDWWWFIARIARETGLRAGVKGAFSLISQQRVLSKRDHNTTIVVD